MHFIIGLFKLIWNSLFGKGRRITIERRRYFSATIIKVVDGDTVKIRYNGEITNARLLHIDAPELAQSYGRQSKAHLEMWIASNEVHVSVYKKDKWGRWLVDLLDGRGVSVAKYMIENGYATPFMTNKQEYIKLGERARRNKTGMWRYGNETPKEFRDRQRSY